MATGDVPGWIQPAISTGAAIISIVALATSLRNQKKLGRWQRAERREKRLNELVAAIADADRSHTVAPGATMADRMLVVAAKTEALETAFAKHRNYLSSDAVARLDERIASYKAEAELAVAAAGVDQQKLDHHTRAYANGMAAFVLDLSETAQRELEAAVKA